MKKIGRNKYKYQLLATIFLLSCFFLFAGQGLAIAKENETPVKSWFGLTKTMEGLGSDAVFGSETPWGATKISEFIGGMLQVVSALLGGLLFLVIFYAGFLWLTSAGNAEQAGKAKKIITSGVVGFFIVALSYFIVKYISGTFSYLQS